MQIELDIKRCVCGRERKSRFHYCNKCRIQKLRARSRRHQAKRNERFFSDRDSSYWYFHYDQAMKTRYYANIKGVF